MFSIKPFPVYIQLDAMDCGPTCLRMIAKYYGKHYQTQIKETFFYAKYHRIAARRGKKEP